MLKDFLCFVVVDEITEVGFSPLNTDAMRKNEYEINQTNKPQQNTKFHSNPFSTLGYNWH